MSIDTINPATGVLIESYPEMSINQIDKIIDDCHDDFETWSQLNFSERAQYLKKISSLLNQQKKQLATLIANEMGKPITLGEAEVEKCILVCDFYAQHAEAFLQPEVIKTNFSKSYVTYEPMGIVFAIMPWNFPLWQVFRYLAPNLMAGNGCLLKHAPISTGTALAIERLLQQAGLPENIFRVFVIDVDKVEHIVKNPKITGVTLTGSKNAGACVAALAGKYLKKCVLELGGCDPYLIFEDADLEQAANTCVRSRLSNSGQVCIAAKRIIVIDHVYEKFQQYIEQAITKTKMGDPLNAETTMGPLARHDLRETVHLQVEKSIAEGARLVCGGKLPKDPGCYYAPTLLTHVTAEMTAFKEEVFGPVVTLIHANNTEHAIQLANETNYGLGAALFTKNDAQGEEIIKTRLQAGTCALNTFVRSDPNLPFGGIKESGFGRELSASGLKTFLNVKTIQII